ncbi:MULTISPECIES: DUF2851 family protein [Pedobacter]|uniref:DUF2851 domain-containing protein n=1 Tax=Pedobacter heparinus (strain ATCC 13125 / DSM 2366 / CIP 104194 / JCM 7457 / NBRC 12017 / NCIMB 9290 / NRRL B-14731 / HIM 762-3) TaxID=485917 RepID=C6Y2Q5_PEDHD|nr:MULTISPECIES: DUF2851 family protein [Pedobacter]ACU05265.1 hypothetical protein Phep_3068 [Pedobacter heparinus DSM 2366]MBB5439601.1 hypothetical protein [Pedobacter sp. AK017]
MDFSEHFLHFIWRFRLFNTFGLFCTDGERLEILTPGLINKDAGPDFSMAKLMIGNTRWAGQVELHLKSSDWFVHGHDKDPAYNAVILHVVYQHDQPVYRTNGSLIPVLVLKDLFPRHLLNIYRELMAGMNRFPCEKHIKNIDPIVIHSFLARIIIERFEHKSEEIFHKLAHNRGDWELTFYHFMAKSFGFKVNAVPFELLADALPYPILLKHKDNALQIAALLFGQAGFLTSGFTETYPRQLQKEYSFLQQKYRLMPLNIELWKFLRMRPQNFPTIRLAQFAALMLKSSHLFSRILETENLKDLCKLFIELPVDVYWQTHYHFNKVATKVVVQPGVKSVHSIIINTVCLFLFSYGKYTDQPEYIDRALNFLENLPAESNAIVGQYVSSGLKVGDALMSQALLQLNKCYCTQKKCLNCGIGIKILKK